MLNVAATHGNRVPRKTKMRPVASAPFSPMFEYDHSQKTETRYPKYQPIVHPFVES